MTIPNDIITSYSDISNFFTGSSINKFDINKEPFKNQRSMTFRVVGKMKDIFLRGPLRYSKIKVNNLDQIEQAERAGEDQDSNTNRFNDTWPKEIASVGVKLIKAGLSPFVSVLEGEGATIWCLVPDDSLSTTLLDIIGSDIKNKRWATAFTTAQKQLGGTGSPFAISFIASCTFREIPFFGRTAWGVAVKNEIISLTQISLINPANKDNYFTWSFVSKVPITESELYNKAGGKGGGENDYTSFKKVREYLEKECVPLDPTGDYPGIASGDESPIDKGSKIDNDSYIYSVNESRLIAESYLLTEYGFRNDSEDDPDYIGKERANLPSGEPYVDKLTVKEVGIPVYGPLY